MWAKAIANTNTVSESCTDARQLVPLEYVSLMEVQEKCMEICVFVNMQQYSSGLDFKVIDHVHLERFFWSREYDIEGSVGFSRS